MTATNSSSVIPVNVAPTAEYGDMLTTRLAFIRQRLVDVEADSLETDV